MPFAILQGMLVEMGKQLGVLQAMTARLEDLGERARVVVKAADKGKRSFDAAFEQDFAHLRMETRTMMTKLGDFEHFASRAVKVMVKLPNVGEAAAMSKTVLMGAKKFSLEVDHFVSAFSVAKSYFRKMQSNIYWWDLEQFSSELTRSISQIILLITIISNAADKKDDWKPKP